MITRLVIVTVALAAVMVALRLRNGRGSRRAAQLRITARTSLHRNAFLAVVEIEGRRLLIGAGQQVQLIAELEPVPVEETRDRPELPSELPAVPDEAETFLERARRATSRTLDPAARARHRQQQDDAA